MIAASSADTSPWPPRLEDSSSSVCHFPAVSFSMFFFFACIGILYLICSLLKSCSVILKQLYQIINLSWPSSLANFLKSPNKTPSWVNIWRCWSTPIIHLRLLPFHTFCCTRFFPLEHPFLPYQSSPSWASETHSLGDSSPLVTFLLPIKVRTNFNIVYSQHPNWITFIRFMSL